MKNYLLFLLKDILSLQTFLQIMIQIIIKMQINFY